MRLHVIRNEPPRSETIDIARTITSNYRSWVTDARINNPDLLNEVALEAVPSAFAVLTDSTLLAKALARRDKRKVNSLVKPLQTLVNLLVDTVWDAPDTVAVLIRRATELADVLRQATTGRLSQDAARRSASRIVAMMLETHRHALQEIYEDYDFTKLSNDRVSSQGGD